jgi:hypothetical protein
LPVVPPGTAIPGIIGEFNQEGRHPSLIDPSAVSDEGLLWGISPRSLELKIRCQELRAPMAQSTLVLA